MPLFHVLDADFHGRPRDEDDWDYKATIEADSFEHAAERFAIKDNTWGDHDDYNLLLIRSADNLQDVQGFKVAISLKYTAMPVKNEGSKP